MSSPSPTHKAHTLIVADIHLQQDSSHSINKAFKSFLETEAPKSEALYILGDLFEMWVGDDIGIELYSEIINLLAELTQQGLPIYLQYGNRDFLMREEFFGKTGIILLDDIVEIELYQTSYLLLHGDTLCTEDRGYQRMRRLFRNKIFQWFFLHLCKKRRLAFGNRVRHSSEQQSGTKNAQIMDVNQQAVIDLFEQYPHISNMIHGHTHRPMLHKIETNHRTLKRWVLGDWRPQAKIIRVNSNGPELIDYPDPKSE